MPIDDIKEFEIQVTNQAQARIQKMSICYGSNLSSLVAQQFIAEHFDLLDCNRNLSSIDNVKELNPDIKVIGYYDTIMMATTYPDWDYVNQNEDWFVHDKNGNRIIPSSYPNNRLMNPNSGWGYYFAQKCQESLNNYPLYDGIFGDDIPLDLVSDGYQFTVPFSDFEPGVLDNWSDWMMQYIQNVQNAMGNKMLMVNAWKSTQFCEQVTHSHFFEGFIHGRATAYDNSGYGYSTGWNGGLLAVDLLRSQARLGNVIAVNSGCKDADLHPVEAKQWMLFTYACFSFAVVDLSKAYYSWHFYGQNQSNGYYPEMEINLGQPMGDYYNVVSRVYARQFQNYYVVANLDLLGTAPVTFAINGVQHTLLARQAMFIPK